MENMLITSGYDFEGYIITDYLGLCSGEAALGTGFLSSFGANLADFLGTNSSLYEDKLTDARDIALKNLVSHAQSFGADGIIAVQIEYAVFSSDIGWTIRPDDSDSCKLVLHTSVLPSNLSQLFINCNTVGETV